MQRAAETPVLVKFSANVHEEIYALNLAHKKMTISWPEQSAKDEVRTGVQRPVGPQRS